MADILLYNLSGSDKLSRIRVALLRLGLSAREVRPEEYALPLGALAGLPTYEAAEPGEAEEAFTDEMLVMNGLRGARLDAFLDALRRSRATVPLKAVVTEHNAAWTSYRLRRELAAEHAALAGIRVRDAAKKSGQGK